MKKYLEASMSFSEYAGLIDGLLSEGRTTGPKQSEMLVNFTRLNRHRMDRLERTIELGDTIKKALAENDRPQIWLTITEGWCGDAAQNIPAIEKIAAESDTIETRYILRDDNPELIDRYLTKGARSIPKLIALDSETLEVLWTWGARPEAAQTLFETLRESGLEKAAILEKLQRWYNDDKAKSIQNEISDLIGHHAGRKTARRPRKISTLKL
jgi:hypothetical protein